jgi:FHS family L-fucose permease-like MFS transporter
MTAPPHQRLLALMMSMFFAFGFCTVLVDTLVPKFKAMFALSYAEVMLTQFCYFGAYFIVSLPAGWLLGRIGYLRSIVVGLMLMASGALGFGPAALIGSYPAFLFALFVLACGVTIVQVAANPVTALAGSAATASSRLTLAQAFNSLATMIGPQFGAYLILSSLHTPPAGADAKALEVFRQHEAHVFVAPFAYVALVLAGLALLCWRVRAWSPPAAPRALGSVRQLLGERRLMLGAASIFAYVGAEVSIGSAMANYLMQGTVLGLTAATAGRLVSLYWGGAMVGRFAGTLVLRHIKPGLALGVCALCAAALATVSGLSNGLAAAGTLLAIGLCNSIMFPTIFTLAIEGLGEKTPEASGLVCLAIVGGAVVPLTMGVAADRFGLAHALVVPVLCYLWIAFFAVWVSRAAVPSGDTAQAH